MENEKIPENKFELDLSFINYQPTMDTIYKWCEQKGLVGERGNVLTLILIGITKQHAGIEALSGAGKSKITDILFNHQKYGDDILFPPEDIFILSLSSKTATSYMQKQINKSKLILIEELQKAGESLEVTEMLKNIAEGKDSTRVVTSMKGNRANVNQYTIKKGKGIIYTLAIENKKKTDPEMKRRFIILDTNVTNQQTEKIKHRKAQERFLTNRLVKIDDVEENNIKAHIKECLNISDNFIFENPFADHIINTIPTPNQKIRSFIDHYFNLIEASILFYNKNRLVYTMDEVSKKNKDKKHIIANIEDIFTIQQLYGDSFNKDIHSIPPIGMEVLNVMSNADKKRSINKRQLELAYYDISDDADNQNPLTMSEIQQELKKKEINISHKVLKDTCELLYNEGYIEADNNTKNVMYYIVENYEDYKKNIDWVEMFDNAYGNMLKYLPDKADDWYDKQIKDGKCIVNDPMSGEEVVLFETN